MDRTLNINRIFHPRERAVPAAPRRRIVLIDELRGLAVISMVVYHILYDLVAIFNLPIRGFWGPPYSVFEFLIAFTFISVSGVSCSFSKNNLKRGFVVLGAAMGMTLVTYLVMPDQLILFGVLHFLGVSIILYSLLRKPVGKVPAIPGAAVSSLLFILTFHTQAGYWGLPWLKLNLPGFLYVNGLFPLGFYGKSFFSADYFPLLPWFFLFLAGVFIGRMIKDADARGKELPSLFYRDFVPPQSFLGRHSLAVYILHQPVIYGILLLLFAFLPR